MSVTKKVIVACLISAIGFGPNVFALPAYENAGNGHIRCIGGRKVVNISRPGAVQPGTMLVTARFNGAPGDEDGFWDVVEIPETGVEGVLFVVRRHKADEFERFLEDRGFLYRRLGGFEGYNDDAAFVIINYEGENIGATASDLLHDIIDAFHSPRHSFLERNRADFGDEETMQLLDDRLNIGAANPNGLCVHGIIDFD